MIPCVKTSVTGRGLTLLISLLYYWSDHSRHCHRHSRRRRCHHHHHHRRRHNHHYHGCHNEKMSG